MIITIDTLSPSPIYEQIRNQVVLGIAAGRLAPGEGLPSVRRLAADLGINFHTVNKSYSILCDEGYVVMDRRVGAVVAQKMSADTTFHEQLAAHLRLAAAEAACHGINEDEFVNLCKTQYHGGVKL